MNIKITREEADNLLIFIQEGFPNFFRCSVDGFDMMESICDLRRKLIIAIEKEDKKTGTSKNKKETEENQDLFKEEPDPIESDELPPPEIDEGDDFIATVKRIGG